MNGSWPIKIHSGVNVLSLESKRVVKPFLNDDYFKAVIDSVPLVSIDLVVRNSQGDVLLGQRLNKPAQGYWFVPGGRIRKNESLDLAFKRLTLNELRIELDIQSASYLGLYEHFYCDSIYTDESGDESVSTHYLVNGFEIVLPTEKISLPTVQHDAYKWFTQDELMASNCVHVHTKWYFDKDKGFL